LIKAIVISLFLISKLSYSQFNHNQFVLEIKGGFNIPITPVGTIEVSDYTMPRHLDFGLRYMFMKSYGVKACYSLDRFQNKFLNGVGNTYHRLSIEAVCDLKQKFNLFFRTDFNMLIHGGLGITHAYPEAIKRYLRGGRFTFGETPRIPKKYERIGNLIFGITTEYKVSRRIAIIFDATYVFNREQQYTYSGELLNKNRAKVRGGFLNFSGGIYYFFKVNR